MSGLFHSRFASVRYRYLPWVEWMRQYLGKWICNGANFTLLSLQCFVQSCHAGTVNAVAFERKTMNYTYRLALVNDEVQVIANNIREEHPELAEPLIQRWTGASQQFAKV